MGQQGKATMAFPVCLDAMGVFHPAQRAGQRAVCSTWAQHLGDFSK
jgi:hypothetical protein